MMQPVRTTVTLDADTEQVVRKRMREKNMSFKQALNDLIRSGTRGSGGAKPFRTETASMGAPTVSLDRALQLVADLEDDDLLRRAEKGS